MSNSAAIPLDRDAFEALYRRFNRRSEIHPDPLEFVHRYERAEDREVVGLIASSLAYGRVAQILRNVAQVLDRLPSPAEDMARRTPRQLRRRLAGFRHRFTTGEELADLMVGIGKVVLNWKGLGRRFADLLADTDDTVLPAAARFVGEIGRAAGREFPFLLPSPAGGSACKRLNLFLKWMVRRDALDVGDWRDVPASKLVYPLDTHIYKAGRALGLTRRGQADLRAAVEVTKGFGRIAPDDPVRYDFALAHLGFRGELDVFLRSVQDGAKFLRIPAQPRERRPECLRIPLRRQKAFH